MGQWRGSGLFQASRSGQLRPPCPTLPAQHSSNPFFCCCHPNSCCGHSAGQGAGELGARSQEMPTGLDSSPIPYFWFWGAGSPEKWWPRSGGLWRLFPEELGPLLRRVSEGTAAAVTMRQSQLPTQGRSLGGGWQRAQATPGAPSAFISIGPRPGHPFSPSQVLPRRFWHPFLIRSPAGGLESPVCTRRCDLLSYFPCLSGHPSHTESFWKAGPVPPQILDPHSPCLLWRPRNDGLRWLTRRWPQRPQDSVQLLKLGGLLVKMKLSRSASPPRPPLRPALPSEL